MSLRTRTTNRLEAFALLWDQEGPATDRRIHEWALEPTTSSDGTIRSIGAHPDPTATSRPNTFTELKDRWATAHLRLRRACGNYPPNSPAKLARTVAIHLRAGRPATDKQLHAINAAIEELEHLIYETTPLPIAFANELLNGTVDHHTPGPECFACATPITGRTKSRLCPQCRSLRNTLVNRDPDALNDTHFAERVRTGIEAGTVSRPGSPLNPRRTA